MIHVEGLTKRFDEGRGEMVVALDDVALEVADGELLVVVGPSGSGKSTLLRCIAGLESPDSGLVEIAGVDVTAAPPGERDVAMVFQDLALYPHLSVAENIAFGLRTRKTPSHEVESAVSEVARALDLENVLSRRPHQLSGGEKQRTALARAAVRKPRIFLMDEPLSSLDQQMRSRARMEVRQIQRRLGTSTVYVTHDQTEAMTLGDRVAVMRNGRIEQIAAPDDLYQRPATAFVASFFGQPPMSIVSARTLGLDGAALAGIRPERLRLGPTGTHRARVVTVEVLGSDAVVHLSIGSEDLTARVPRADSPAEGQEVALQWDERDVHRFTDDGRLLA